MGRSESLEAFASAYLHRVPDDEEPTIGPDQLSAEISCAYGFLDGRGASTLAVRVFAPTPETCGYSTPGSVIEIVTDDMPFLVDSVMSRLARLGYTTVRHFHPVVGTVRGENGALIEVAAGKGASRRESVQHYELVETLSSEEASTLETELLATLADVRAAVKDFEPMRFAVRRMVHYAFEDGSAFDPDDVEEAVAFLEWLLDDNFILLGYREYDIADTGDGPAIAVKEGSGLGILEDADASRFAEPVPLASLEPDLRDRYEHGRQLVIAKTNRRSTVHRDARMDYIGLRRVHADGTPKGEARLVGLFTSKAYMAVTATIPILRRKLANVLSAEDLIEGSHDYKVISQIFESFPKDELFSISQDDLRMSLVGLLEAEEHQHVRLFVRRDVLHRNVSILVVIPRDRFDTNLRKNLQDLFLERYGGASIDYQLTLGETGDARIHFTVWLEGAIPTVSLDDLERDVYSLTRTWEDRVCRLLAQTMGQPAARALIDTHAHRYPAYFKSSTSLEGAASSVLDVDAILSSRDSIRIGIRNETESEERLTRIMIYSREGKRDLSEMLPLVENMGLRVVEEIPTRLSGDGDDEMYLHDFGVLGSDGNQVDVDACGVRVAAALTAALIGETESDGLSRLLILTDLDHRQINILRAYRSYWHLVNPAFSKPYVAAAFAAHPDITGDLVRLFELRFGPDADETEEEELRGSLIERLDAVASLDEDRILRAFLGLINATVRTTAFIGNGAIAFKFLSDRVPDIPDPRPMYEIFVFAPAVAGVHLRGGPVARGGIRWSVRREDYRTEVLGLMKAQMTKNAVIVPTGAKGGFVIRTVADPSTGPTFDEVKSGYRTFIRSLLDITDNLDGGNVVHPTGVRVLDGDDPYFVVAADRGTATFSDMANAIAADVDFWLDDAFASGGSSGYDHKALGITARGAWESVRRHFMDLDLDIETDPFTVVGVGDMSGDVFGNGMLLSRTIKLIAAFDHRHIFIDPDPDPERSFAERERLAQLREEAKKERERLEALRSPSFDRLLKAYEGMDPANAAAALVELYGKNRRVVVPPHVGVDPARNHAYKWAYDDIGSSPNPWSHAYRGPQPWSDAEARAARDLEAEHRFRTQQDFHCFGGYNCYPWTWTRAAPPEREVAQETVPVEVAAMKSPEPEPVGEHDAEAALPEVERAAEVVPAVSPENREAPFKDTEGASPPELPAEEHPTIPIAPVAATETDIDVEASDYVHRADVYLSMDEYEKAIQEYGKAIGLDPNFEKAYYNRGLAYAQQQKYPEAVADLTRAIDLNPEHATAYYNRGLVYARQYDLVQAIADYDQAIAREPADAALYNSRANAYYKIKDYQRAIADYDQAIRREPAYADAYLNRGLAYATIEEYQHAIADYNQAIALNPESAIAYNYRGLAYARLQQYARALEDYDQALSLNPQYAIAYNNRGLCYVRLKNYAQAVAAYERAVATDPQYATAHYNAACAAALNHDADVACAWLEKAIHLAPRYRAMAQRDADFDPIREDTAFQTLVAENAIPST